MLKHHPLARTAGLVVTLWCLVCFVPFAAAQEAQAEDTVTSPAFPSWLWRVIALGDNQLMCVTGDGWYRGDLGTNRWWEFLSLNDVPEQPEVRHVGHGKSLAYFLERTKSRSLRLVRYPQRGQKRELLDEQVTHAHFISDDVGVTCDKERGIRVTRDGGQTWLALDQKPDFSLRRLGVLALADDQAVVAIQSAGTGRVWYQPLPSEQADPTPKGWSSRLPIAPHAVLGVRDGCVWLLGSDLLGLDREDGSVRYRLPIHHESEKVLMNDQWTLIVYQNKIEAVRWSDDQWKTLFIHRLPYRVTDVDFMTDEAGRTRLVLADEKGRLALWGPLDEQAEPKFQHIKSLTFENGAPVEKPKQAKRLKEAIAKIGQMTRLARQVPEEVAVDIMKRAEELEPEERVDWIITELKKYLKANPPEEKD